MFLETYLLCVHAVSIICGVMKSFFVPFDRPPNFTLDVSPKGRTVFRIVE